MFLGQLAAMLERRRLTATVPSPLTSHRGRQPPDADAAAAPDAAPGETSQQPRGRWPISITRLEALEAARAVLPYTLTGSQDRVLRDVLADMAGPGVMMRLLQGDVGCGKTVVALMAMMAASGSGESRVGGGGEVRVLRWRVFTFRTCLPPAAALLVPFVAFLSLAPLAHLPLTRRHLHAHARSPPYPPQAISRCSWRRPSCWRSSTTRRCQTWRSRCRWRCGRASRWSPTPSRPRWARGWEQEMRAPSPRPYTWLTAFSCS
jgi:hypothetical protein